MESSKECIHCKKTYVPSKSKDNTRCDKIKGNFFFCRVYKELNENSCISCETGKNIQSTSELVKGKCLELKEPTLPDGKYQPYNSLTPKDCHTGCKTCTGPNSTDCLSCKGIFQVLGFGVGPCIDPQAGCGQSKFYNIKTASCDDCSKGCTSCTSLSICTTCSSKYSLKNGKCEPKEKCGKGQSLNSSN